MDIRAYNREAWNRQVESGENPWTQPVGPDVIARARQGDWSVLLTEQTPVPRSWFPPDLRGLNILALACGGGQQGPIFAAAGANVTVLDNSPRQLERDQMVAAREGLTNLRTVEGDARDLSAFEDASFDLVFNPVSTCFIPEVRPIWRECFRVLRPGGVLMTGFMNPVMYIFDLFEMDEGRLVVKYSVPYTDAGSLPPADLEKLLNLGWPLEHSHTLTDQIAGQTDAGFHIVGLYEDQKANMLLGRYHPLYIATRAIKPG
ncbi:MAG: methyltransferase domain-containing protein [Anaerolineales bacterium]